MGVLFDYFAAPSDDEAAAVIDRAGGPGSRELLAPPAAAEKRRLFRRKDVPPERSMVEDPDLVIYTTVSLKGIDPVVQMGTLESFLTGTAYDAVVSDPRSGHAVAERDGGERVVCTLTDSLATALADAGPEAIERVAEPWSKTEEFWGQAEPEELAGVLRELAALARHARDSGQRLYCWVCV